MNKFLFSVVLLSFSRSSKLWQLYHHGDPSKSLQGFTLCFQLLFLFVDHSFTGVLHGGSTWWVIKDSISSRSVSSSFFSKELKHSSSCNPECISFYRIIGGGFTSFLIFEFMFHDSHVVKNGVF